MSAPGDLYRCANCGASLSLEQLRGTNCPFCSQVFPHHGRAVEHAALVNQIMAQQFQQHAPYAQPPQIAPQYGAPPPTAPNPYAQHHQAFQASVARSAKITGVVMIVVFGLFGLLFVGGMVAVFLLR